MPTSIALTPHFESLTQRLVSSGRYNNVSEVIRDSLRLLEDRIDTDAAKLQALRKATTRGFADINSGDFVALDNDEEITRYIRAAGTRAVVS